MRVLVLFALTVAVGCSTWPFASASADKVSAEAVRSYAQAHDLTRDEARRELSMFRDADQLKELRSQKETTKGQTPMTNGKANDP